MFFHTMCVPAAVSYWKVDSGEVEEMIECAMPLCLVILVCSLPWNGCSGALIAALAEAVLL